MTRERTFVTLVALFFLFWFAIIALRIVAMSSSWDGQPKTFTMLRATESGSARSAS